MCPRRCSPRPTASNWSGGSAAFPCWLIPTPWGIKSAELDDFVGQKADGLGGIEAYYLSDSRCPVEFYREIAQRFDLCLTGGSDYHGPVKPEVAIGTGRGKTHALPSRGRTQSAPDPLRRPVATDAGGSSTRFNR